MAEAEKIAQEIEGVEADGNIHVAEERGQFVDRKGLDDEDLYSGVLRTGEDVAKATGDASTAKTVISTTAKGETSDSDGGAKKADKPAKFTLNPNAFSFNPKAKEFVPGGGASRIPPTSTTPSLPAQTVFNGPGTSEHGLQYVQNFHAGMGPMFPLSGMGAGGAVYNMEGMFPRGPAYGAPQMGYGAPYMMPNMPGVSTCLHACVAESIKRLGGLLLQ